LRQERQEPLKRSAHPKTKREERKIKKEKKKKKEEKMNYRRCSPFLKNDETVIIEIASQ